MTRIIARTIAPRGVMRPEGSGLDKLLFHMTNKVEYLLK